MITDVENELATYGYLQRPIDPYLNLVEEIQILKREKNAVILAHYYQESEIQDLADYIGDSLGLSQEAARTDARMIVFAGVHFMAEVAKIICPDKKVVLPDLKAGCSLADSAPAEAFRKFKEQHPDHVVISYINCSAEVKSSERYHLHIIQCRKNHPQCAAGKAYHLCTGQKSRKIPDQKNRPGYASVEWFLYGA